MAVVLNKRWAFALTLCGAMTVACASEPVEDERVLELAADNLRAATTELGEVIEACEAKSAELSPDMFSEVAIPDKSLMIALLHLSNQQREKCEGEAWRDFAYQLHVYKSVADHLNQEPTVSPEYEPALYSSKWRWLKLELQYRELDSRYRDTLEAMPELNRPFEPAPVIDTLGKSEQPAGK